MKLLNARTMLVLTYRSDRILLCHGGFDKKFLSKSKKYRLEAGQWDSNLVNVNQIYEDSFLGDRTNKPLERVLRAEGDREPTWCRPVGLPNFRAMQQFLGVTKIAVAHTIQHGVGINLQLSLIHI